MTKIIKLPDVIRMTTLSRSSIYALMHKGVFPLSVKISEKAVGWVEAEISDYLYQRTQLR